LTMATTLIFFEKVPTVHHSPGMIGQPLMGCPIHGNMSQGVRGPIYKKYYCSTINPYLARLSPIPPPGSKLVPHL
jgi:hypothetical protein